MFYSLTKQHIDMIITIEVKTTDDINANVEKLTSGRKSQTITQSDLFATHNGINADTDILVINDVNAIDKVRELLDADRLAITHIGKKTEYIDMPDIIIIPETIISYDYDNWKFEGKSGASNHLGILTHKRYSVTISVNDESFSVSGNEIGQILFDRELLTIIDEIRSKSRNIRR